MSVKKKFSNLEIEATHQMVDNWSREGRKLKIIYDKQVTPAPDPPEHAESLLMTMQNESAGNGISWPLNIFNKRAMNDHRS
jgi:serine/threonine-protein kinase RIO1